MFRVFARGFARLDLWLARHSKRENLAIFCLPLLLCIGVAFAVVLPPIDESYTQSQLHLAREQDLANALAEIPPNHANQELQETLTYKRQLLQALKERAIKSATLAKKLGTFTSNIRHSKENLTIQALGDVEMLEDIIELLETQHFVFIQNLSISAPFASSLDMRFDVLNFGERL